MSPNATCFVYPFFSTWLAAKCRLPSPPMTTRRRTFSVSVSLSFCKASAGFRLLINRVLPSSGKCASSIDQVSCPRPLPASGLIRKTVSARSAADMSVRGLFCSAVTTPILTWGPACLVRRDYQGRGEPSQEKNRPLSTIDTSSIS